MKLKNPDLYGSVRQIECDKLWNCAMAISRAIKSPYLPGELSFLPVNARRFEQDGRNRIAEWN